MPRSWLDERGHRRKTRRCWKCGSEGGLSLDRSTPHRDRIVKTWHVFFDTTELFARRFLTNAEVRMASGDAEAQAYVPDLVVEERVAQELAEPRQVGPLPKMETDNERRAYIRGRLLSQLAGHATITPPGGPIDQNTQLRLFESRLKAGFKDAAIVLSVIEFARIRGMASCIFVTDDGGLRAAAGLQRFGESQGVSLFFVESYELRSLLPEKPEKVEAATTFVKQHIEQINHYLGRETKRRLIEAMFTQPGEMGYDKDLMRAFVAHFESPTANLESVRVEVYDVHEVIPQVKTEEARKVPVLVRLSVNIEVPGFTAGLYLLDGVAIIRSEGGRFVEPFEVTSVVVPPGAFPYG